MKFIKTNYKKFLIVLLVGLSSVVFAQETEDQSSGAYASTKAKKELNSLDKNNDGKYEKSENEKAWKRYQYLDANKDESITFEEFKNIKLKYLETNGKRKLNVLYKSTEESSLYLDIYYPTNTTNLTNLPVIIYTHGGGWAAGSKMSAGNASFAKVFDALTKKGFCVVSVDYRLYSKGGTVSIRDCVIDAKDAARYLSKNSKELGLNPKRFFAFGDSAGGQMAQMLLLSDSKSLEGDENLTGNDYNMVAGSSWYGPCDFEKTSLYNYDDRPNFHDRFGPRILELDSNPKDKLKLYREMSPINYLTKKSPPLLIIQGDGDTTIPVKHAYYMQEKAQKVNAPVEVMIIKNAGHNWREATPGTSITPTREAIIKKTINFFESFL
ncbi:alpha/beta hydrolase fold domain-containing protein [Formosa sp. PL04]|uniref:alpha/beta hydrolase fold domain-containing protein n=1 Tax=Formosa sp. PL04 TaxID=3081755 RepID=UPI0029812709|nr:alpha/beta hydrolase fold domain-containing protein [Formosa sp. PL04]MDW5290832.1 alpha/beta hydrolase fold domain-containing protein [Formosa sp. PL04]